MARAVETYTAAVKLPWYGGPVDLPVKVETDAGIKEVQVSTFIVPLGTLSALPFAFLGLFFVRSLLRLRSRKLRGLQADLRRLEKLVADKQTSVTAATTASAVDDPEADRVRSIREGIKRARRNQAQQPLERLALALHDTGEDALAELLAALQQAEGDARRRIIAAAATYGLHRLASMPGTAVPDDLLAAISSLTVKDRAEPGAGTAPGSARTPDPAVRLSVPDVAAPAGEELTEFVAAVAHDLLEPLSTVNGYLDLFLRRHGDGLSADGRELVEAAVAGAQGMQALVGGLLELTGTAAARRDHQPVDVGAIVIEVVARLSNTLASAGGTVVVDEPLPTVLGDDVELARLFQNLIANVVKFHRPEVAPVVRVSASAALATGAWELSVVDNGIGIDPAQREQVFATFTRLHPRSRFPGSGLGLAICRRIVRDHGGDIWVEDAPGGGSAFRFTLPAVVAP